MPFSSLETSPGVRRWGSKEKVGRREEGGEEENSHRRRLSGIDGCRSSCGCSPSERVYKMWKSPAQSLFSPDTNGTLQRTRADPLAEGGSTGKAPSSGPPGTKDAASNLSSPRLSWPTATVNTQSPLQGGKIKYLIKIFGC